MTSYHRIVAYGLTTALAVTVIVGIAQANWESADVALKKTDRGLPAADLIAASFALFDAGTLNVSQPAAGITVVNRTAVE
jgi:hypothetical protein